MPQDASEDTRRLLARLAALQARVAEVVARRRERDPTPDDPFRGLYLSDDQVDRLLAEGGTGPAASPGGGWPTAGEGPPGPRRLAERFGLDPLDLEILLVALAPDLDSRFERLYGYLNDDVTRRRASIGLALELCGRSAADATARRRLGPGGPLLRGALVLVEDAERPFLTRSLRVPDRVTAHLLGDDRADPAIADLLVAAPPGSGPGPGVPAVAHLGRAVEEALGPVYLRARQGSAAPALAVAALAAAGRDALRVDLTRMAPDAAVAADAGLLAREARLRHAGLIVEPLESLLERGPAAVRSFAELPVPVVLVGRLTWDQGWADAVPLILDVPAASAAERANAWRASLDGDVPAGLDAEAVMAQFLLAPEQISRAARAARLQARLTGAPLGPAQLRAGARAQNASGLERLARRIEPRVGWDDLVLPADTLAQLREVADRATHRERVLVDWSMRPGGGRGRGVTALFAGDSGTGKTMSAEVIADDLGLDLYAVDLATVVDKYVGETEKNLERIFTEAGGVNGVLLFDEADAIFGKRSEVRDAHDRYANIESAYLLQRMESFDGLAILATNLRANLDEAFTRRLDAVVDFPVPDEAHRRRLWDRCLAPAVPRGLDLDLDFCAAAFELSGGNIRSIALTAAYLAAAGDRPVWMADLVLATQREYRKLGRLCLESEFGPYYGLLS
jgi:hypothetical protein